ncbi:unnamed protein product [Protopolystoma xenopodis]|uniref:Uncharacterized protein n=1 Tax=Protopolystoma xenopodis TaxID=117903 RepID=A0A448XT82_9PLAT|nr:unnamed protein product [Protopolystoma xenopodis]
MICSDDDEFLPGAGIELTTLCTGGGCLNHLAIQKVSLIRPSRERIDSISQKIACRHYLLYEETPRDVRL